MSADRISSSRTGGGIPVAVDRIADCRSAGYMVAVDTGSRDESEDVLGISHLLEHVVFRETRNRTSYQMAKEIEGAGGELNAFTGREITAFYAVTIKETKDVAKEMVADIVAHPLIKEEDVELEKRIVLQELSMVRNEPESYIRDLFSENMWRGHPLSQDEGGPVEIVESLSADDLAEYYAERYGIPNLAVFAAGDADADEVAEWAGGAFDGMSGKKASKRREPKRPEAAYNFVGNDSDHLHVGMGVPAFRPDDDRRIPALVLSAMLGSGTSSRLFQEVREKKALVYSVHTVVEQHSDAAALVAYMSCTEDNVIEAIETVAGIYAHFKAEGVQEGELERTKRLLKGAYVRSMESTERRMYRLGREYMLTGRCESTEERLEAIEAVTEEDIMEAAGELLRSRHLNTTVLGKGNGSIRRFDQSHLDI
ncbi:MAG: insulinase family protein [Euryarchaeota archaeon]|nr:insulinase family protein [Euryarchaeota archaeon]